MFQSFRECASPPSKRVPGSAPPKPSSLPLPLCTSAASLASCIACRLAIGAFCRQFLHFARCRFVCRRTGCEEEARVVSSCGDSSSLSSNPSPFYFYTSQHPRDSVGSQIGGRVNRSGASQVVQWLQQWLQPVLKLLPGPMGNRLENYSSSTSSSSRDGHGESDDDDDDDDKDSRGKDGPTFADVAGTEAAKQVCGMLEEIIGKRSSLDSFSLGALQDSTISASKYLIIHL